MTTINTTPKALIALRKAAGEKPVQAGDTVDFHSGNLQLEPHAVYGPIPVLTVLQAVDGEIRLAQFRCGCGELVEVHPGDIFQKRRCKTCQDKAAGSKRPKMSAEEKAAKKELNALAKAQAKYEKALAKAEETKEKAQQEMARLEAERAGRSELIAKVAAEKGVEVSR